MYRGTTPDYILSIPGYDITEATIFVTIKQGSGRILTLTNDALIVSGDSQGTSIAFSLTQKQTLNFKAGTANVQARFIFSDNEAYATDTKSITIRPILYEREIHYAGNND